MKKFKINSGTFPFGIKVIISKDVNKVVHWINKKQHRKGSDKYQVDVFNHSFGVYCKGGHYESVIWIADIPKTARQHTTVSHEILHAVFDCLDYMRIEYCEKSEEAFAYLHSHLLKQFLRKCGLK